MFFKLKLNIIRDYDDFYYLTKGDNNPVDVNIF